MKQSKTKTKFKEFICKGCQKPSSIDMKYVRYADKQKENRGVFCSIECFHNYQSQTLTKGKNVECAQCSKSFWKKWSQMIKSKSGNHFCSKSCAAKFNNKHKTTGTRKSKLEVFIANKIREEFPTLPFKENTVDDIDHELDFFFPTLKLAIEINGIFHHKPIFGEEKLASIQRNDRLKKEACELSGLDLKVVDDISNHFKEQQALEHWAKIKEMILQKIKV